MWYLSSRSTQWLKVSLSAATAATAIVGAAAAVDTNADERDARQTAGQWGHARNVILFIGDGMGDSELTIARDYHVGAAGRFALDDLSRTAAMTTYSVQKDNPSIPDYVTDSAAAATGFATGHKTYDGAISVLPDGTPVPSVLELAKKAGYRTGDVTTAAIQDATPAAFASHVVSRTCKGPKDMARCPANATENGGAGSISEQMIASGADVMLGGGRQYFDQKTWVPATEGGADPTADGPSVLDRAKENGYTVVTDAAGLGAITASRDRKVLGTFAKEALDNEWTGPVATAKGTTPSQCEVNASRDSAQPRLPDMAAKAIELLDEASRFKRKGFFLMVEASGIDVSAHGANACGQIGATVALDAAVQKSLDYQRWHPDTLIIVTADHANAPQIVEAGSTSAGNTVTLITKDNANLTVSYATARTTQQHTGTEVRIAASGPRSSRIQGVIDHTDLFATMAEALGVRP